MILGTGKILLHLSQRDGRLTTDQTRIRSRHFLQVAPEVVRIVRVVAQRADLLILGSRNCIGRRFAETEGQILLAQLVQNFVIEPVSGKTGNYVFEGTMKPVGLECRFIPRHQSTSAAS